MPEVGIPILVGEPLLTLKAVGMSMPIVFVVYLFFYLRVQGKIKTYEGDLRRDHDPLWLTNAALQDTDEVEAP